MPRRLIDDERLRSLIEAGYNLDYIAAELGFSRKVICNAARKRLGMPRRRSGFPPLDTEKVAWLRREGLTVRLIADKLGCHPRTVQRALARLREVS